MENFFGCTDRKYLKSIQNCHKLNFEKNGTLKGESLLKRDSTVCDNVSLLSFSK